MLSINTIVNRMVSNALKKAIVHDAKEELRNAKRLAKEETKRIEKELKHQARVFKKAMKTKLPDDEEITDDDRTEDDTIDSDTTDDDTTDSDATVGMTYKEFLNKRRVEFIRENDMQIIKDAESREPKLCAKIRAYMEDKMYDDDMVDYTFEKIVSDIRTNALVRSFFRKDPVRQSIHEKTQVEWIRKKLFPDVVKMNGAVGGLYFNENMLTRTHPRPINSSKTLDVYSSDTNTYGVLKFSTTEGGAQDNQYNDVKFFISQMIGYINSSSYSSEKFMFFLDGPYYTDRRLEFLREMVPEDKKDKIIITNVACL